MCDDEETLMNERQRSWSRDVSGFLVDECVWISQVERTESKRSERKKKGRRVFLAFGSSVDSPSSAHGIHWSVGAVLVHIQFSGNDLAGVPWL